MILMTFRQYYVCDHKRYLAEHEYKALKERIAGTWLGFKKVSCINATLPWSHVATISDDICKSCKFSKGQEERVVVGTLDLNQCIMLPDEITGMKPKGIGADFARAYLSNVCVARELRRNGLGYDVIAKAKIVARNWGNLCLSPIDLYSLVLNFAYNDWFLSMVTLSLKS
ncbi:unnamed protein product [Coffea canephora]|uniref:DH200=94 genomic scaffold, scaffold_5905 n=1 Tax=Coffea canephora TaxID=49390 RepID=A0A068VMA3_COFCA|nr:unnamed protein product [Coffea canephora]